MRTNHYPKIKKQSKEDRQLELVLLLREADLLSNIQIKVALSYQERFPCFCFEEIFALNGWIEPHTWDFFANKWVKLVKTKYRKPLGYYLWKSGLLKKSDIDAILLEQQTIPYRFGKIAVMRGYAKPSTINFFLKYLFPEELGESSLRTFDSLIRSKRRHQLYYREVIRRRKLSKEKSLQKPS